MNVKIITSNRGWNVTREVAKNLMRLKDKEAFMQEAFIALQSNIAEFLKNKNIYGDRDFILVEDGYDLIDQKICLCAVISIVDIVMDKSATIQVEMHMMMQSEYPEKDNADIKLT
jgi:hypothetical protein